MSRLDRHRVKYMWKIARRGPTEAGYAFFRARRRRRNVRDEDDELGRSDRLLLSGRYDADASALAANAEVLAAQRAAQRLDVETIQWFLPPFYNPYGGGVHTVLRFADHLAAEHGVESRFCLYDGADARYERQVSEQMAAAFPRLRGVTVTLADHSAADPVAHLPPADAAIATTWTSAFSLLRYRPTKAKLFFVQDFEPAFYPAGAASALLEEVARIGFPGIVNSPGLADAYRAYGNEAVSFTPAVDSERFHPRAERDEHAPLRIVFYGRPSTPRNAFGLGVRALAAVKERHGDRVEILSVGEAWSPGTYGVAGTIENLGLLPDLDAVAALYRSCDIGLVFMVTRHPSYQPFEYMASGLATVSNRNPDTEWFLRHEENALLAPAIPTPVADQLSRLVEDAELRRRLADAGRAQVTATNWSEQFERAWAAVTKRAPGLTAERET